jgi:2-polyprenyl-3-methyl-5-hydroxy-6-metoxy-1,4-benzoquinol methylase
MQETIHGNAKRLAYVASLIERYQPKTVLDVGCGNGVFLTIPLAELFPSTKFIGIDSDRETIDLANTENTCANLRFATNAELEDGMTFDFVLASEVIEHVDDPESFLDWLRLILAERGKLVITTPNGYGPFELSTFVETLMDLSGLMKLLSKVPFLKKLKVGDSYSSGDVRSMQHDTLAISPHVNFFSLGVLESMFERRGYSIVEVRARSFLGGLGSIS